MKSYQFSEFEDEIFKLLEELPTSAGRIMEELEAEVSQTEEETLVGTLEIFGDAVRKGKFSDGGGDSLSDKIDWLLRELKGRDDYCDLESFAKLTGEL